MQTCQQVDSTFDFAELLTMHCMELEDHDGIKFLDLADFRVLYKWTTYTGLMSKYSINGEKN